MRRPLWVASLLLLLTACGCTGDLPQTDHRALAERFLRGVYGADPSVVDELAGEDIIITYPIFSQILDTPAIRGREAVRNFVRGFGERWADAEITIHESVAEDDRVVLVWSFRARSVGSTRPDEPPDSAVRSWGGITLYRFDPSGKIVAEIGEESEPGPAERLNLGGG